MLRAVCGAISGPVVVGVPNKQFLPTVACLHCCVKAMASPLGLLQASPLRGDVELGFPVGS